MIQKSPLEELIAEQKLLCEEFDSAYIKVSGDDVVAVAVETLNQEPIVGIRKKPETEENVGVGKAVPNVSSQRSPSVYLSFS